MLVRHDCDPRGQPARKAKADAAELPEIMVGGEDQRAGLGAHTQRHAETAADMLLEPRRAGEAFGAVDHLRKIGIATCRVRVCPYVLIPYVDVSFIKKVTNILRQLLTLSYTHYFI